MNGNTQAAGSVNGWVLEVDDYELTAFIPVLQAFPATHFGFVVTPNVDHFIRYCLDADFRRLYDAATFRLPVGSRISATGDSRAPTYAARQSPWPGALCWRINQLPDRN